MSGYPITPDNREWLNSELRKLDREIAEANRGSQSIGANVAAVSALVTALDGDVTALDGDVIALDGRTTLLETRPQGVIPSSVVVGSGSASVADDGTVTFTGCSSVSLNDVFDGLGMDVYEITGRFSSSSGSAVVTRVRNAGVDQAGAVYNFMGSMTYSVSGPARSWTFGQSYFARWFTGAAGGGLISGVLTMFSPKKAGNTSCRLLGNVGSSDRYLLDEYGDINSSLGGDGITILATGGTITGQVKVVKIA